ncbi:MAG: MazG-like family protein [Candidatus Fimadaptatus sp.]
MKTIRELQTEAYQNKLDKGFNVTDVNLEFCLTYGELAEAHEAWRSKRPDVGEELADVAIYLMGLAEILGVDLQAEVERKVSKNRRREYAVIDGVTRRVKDAD